MKSPTDLEILLNSQSADLQVCKIAIQVLLHALLKPGSPQAEPAFLQIAGGVLAAVDNIAPVPEAPQDGERLKQLTRVHAEQFLQSTAAALGVDPAKVSRRGAAN